MYTRFRGRRGFTLVELMITVAIVGILAALATVGVRRYLDSSKAAEARNNLGGIGRGVVSSYQGSLASQEMLANGALSTSAANVLCATATPVPAAVPTGTKYQPRTGGGLDFDTGNSQTGWKCVRFTIDSPIRYRYSYTKGNVGLVAPGIPGQPSANGFEAAAQGDVDGDGVRSTFALTGDVNTSTQELKLTTAIYVGDESE